ncbi:hypothetical protein [Salinibius halmophilus]|uniref:hypothetical protein n=1 Tax=Salinibius halmophilus TaxID=1853216 RepID=UPI000E6717D0|nr:hypothetical protein [Salinibius halmophilus]
MFGAELNEYIFFAFFVAIILSLTIFKLRNSGYLKRIVFLSIAFYMSIVLGSAILDFYVSYMSNASSGSDLEFYWNSREINDLGRNVSPILAVPFTLMFMLCHVVVEIVILKVKSKN